MEAPGERMGPGGGWEAENGKPSAPASPWRQRKKARHRVAVALRMHGRCIASARLWRGQPGTERPARGGVGKGIEGSRDRDSVSAGGRVGGSWVKLVYRKSVPSE